MINILVTLNNNYIPALKVMLKSMFENNRGEEFAIYFMYSDVGAEGIRGLKRFIFSEGHRLHMIYVDPDLFSKSQVTRYYSMEMYYRLIAQGFLPEDIDRALYLDPDIVVINSLVEFYHTPFDGAYYIASEHTHSTPQWINKVRLNVADLNGYFNTGVLLMNLEALRRETDMDEIIGFIHTRKDHLFLPDQDIFNILYQDKIKAADVLRYNYDVRYYYLARCTRRSINKQWIRDNTVFLHYCGRLKPWQIPVRCSMLDFYRDYEKKIAI